MRGIMLRALPVCIAVFATGCFLTSPSVGTPVAARTPTHAYWQGAGAVLAQKSTGGEMKDLVVLVRTQTDALRALSPEGVDPALVAAVDDIIKCEEEVLRRADMVGNDPSVLKTNQAMALAFAEANRAAAESKKRLKALRGSLNDRHGGGFAPIGG
jgi:hypothetical protein